MLHALAGRPPLAHKHVWSHLADLSRAQPAGLPPLTPQAARRSATETAPTPTLDLAESMLYKVALVSAMLGVCSGFAPAPVVPRTAVMQRAGAVFMQETEEKAADTETKAAKDAPAVVEYAESLPMLVKRPQLKGYVGDVGFDPLGFSEILPMVRSAAA